MVNASPAFAISCAKVPVLRELAAAVAFSPSLRAAVEHDYVQYIGRTEGADRISVTAEYVIAPQPGHTCSILWRAAPGVLGAPDAGRHPPGRIQLRPVQRNGRRGGGIAAHGVPFQPGGNSREEFLAVCTVEPAGAPGEAENRAPAVDGAGEPAEGELRPARSPSS